MPLHYKIYEPLNLVVYVGQGIIRPSDFYSVESRLLTGKRHEPNRVTFADVFDVAISFSWDDINTFLGHLKFMAQYKAGPYILLTRDQGLHLLARATNLITSKAELQIHIYSNMEDAIRMVGWEDHQHEIFRVWHGCKSQFSTPTEPGQAGSVIDEP